MRGDTVEDALDFIKEFRRGRLARLMANLDIDYGGLLQDPQVYQNPMLYQKMVYLANNQRADEVIDFLQHRLSPQAFAFIA